MSAVRPILIVAVFHLVVISGLAPALARAVSRGINGLWYSQEGSWA
jgi:hypothetical protein